MSILIATRRIGWVMVFAMMVAASAAATESLDSRPTATVADTAKRTPRLLGKQQATPALKVTLPTLSAAEKAKLNQASSQEKFSVVGVGRTLSLQRGVALAGLDWTEAAGTRHSTIEITSSGAAAVRLGLSPDSFPKGVKLYAYGASMPDLVYGPYTTAELRTARANKEAYWLPVIEGETVRLELQVGREIDIENQTLSIPLLSHLLTSIRSESFLKDLSDIGQAGSCNIDVVCPPSNSTWVTRSASVAKYFVTISSGQTGSCTGTLINSSTTATTNYFLTANHCINTVSEASSMHFYWFFQRAACGGPAPTTVNETVGGATFIKTVPANDQTLVRLNVAPPGGATLAGWTTTSLTTNEAVVALHHPAGDLKKYSAGTQQGFTSYSNNTINNSADHVRVIWNPAQGTTEGGSSGSALFNSAGQIVGTLHGGGASCSSPTLPDWYGRFDQAYVGLQPWLTPAGGVAPPPEPPPPPPAPTFTDLVSGTPVTASLVLDESKYYRIQTSASNTGIQVTLTNLSADADLYLFRGSLAAPECQSEAFGVVSESCTLTASVATTWFIEAYGYEAANFTLTATATDPPPAPPPGSGGSSGGGRFGEWLVAMLSILLAVRMTHRMSGRECIGKFWK